MSTSTLPRVRDAQKKAEDSRYYMLRANRQMTTLALSRIYDRLETERVDFNARIKQESLDLKMELIRRAEEEKQTLKADEDMLHDVLVKVARRKKKRADEEQQLKDRKTELKRRVDAKRKDKRFERKADDSDVTEDMENAVPEDEKTDENPVESSGGGKRLSLFPVLPKPIPNDLDTFMPAEETRPKRMPKIKLDLGLIFPNAKKPILYKELMAHRYKRETSRVNEKSLNKLREKYQSLAVEEERKSQEMMEDKDTPYISSISHMMYQVAEDSRQSHMHRILRQVAETRETLRAIGPRLAPSARLKQTLEECVRRRKKRRRKERVEEGKETKERSRKTVHDSASDKLRPPAPIVKPITLDPAPSDEQAREKTDPEIKHPLVNAETDDVEKTSDEGFVEGTEDELTKDTAQNGHDEPVPSGQPDSNSQPLQRFSNEGSVASSKPSSEELASRRVPLRGPVLTPIQSTEVSPQSTREPTEIAPVTNATAPQIVPGSRQPAMDDDGTLDPALWKDVLNCRYIRGYEPPDMRVPADKAAIYVFEKDTPDDTDPSPPQP